MVDQRPSRAAAPGGTGGEIRPSGVPASAARPPHRRRRRAGELVADLLARGGAAGVALQVFVLVGVLVHGAWPAVARHGLRFFISTAWDPLNLQFGPLPMLVGTVVTSVLALLLAVPVSVGAALCLERLCPKRIASVAGFLIELLAAIPSITCGLCGVSILVAHRSGRPSEGAGALRAAKWIAVARIISRPTHFGEGAPRTRPLGAGAVESLFA